MDISTHDKEGLGASEMDDSILTVDFVPCVEEKEGQADNKSGKKAGRKTRSSGRKKAGASARKSVRPDAKGSSTAPSEALETKVAEWTTPVPFATQKLPRLDCAKLPPVLGDFCRELSSEMQVSEESVLANALGAVATCAQSTYSVELYGTSTIQPTNLFIMSPLPSQSRKRASLKTCLGAIARWEQAQAREVEPIITRENFRKMITKRNIRKLAKDAANAQVARNGEAFEALLTQLTDLEMSLRNSTILPRLVTDTLAGLEETVHEQHETLTLASADDNCLDILSSASSRSAKELVAKAWDAEPYTAQKKDRVYHMRPRLTMALSPQKSAFADPRKVKLLQSRGLARNFVYFMPDETQTFANGSKVSKEGKMEKEVANAFFERVLRLLPASWNAPEEARMLTLSPDAELMWLGYRDKAEKLCEGLDAPMQEWATAFANETVGRIAALFHLVSCDNPRTDLVVSSEEMEQALALGDLLFEHAKAAFGLMLQESPAEAAGKILDLVTRNSWRVFSARECFQSLRGQALFRTMKPLNTALEALVEHGYIRTITVKGKSGRPMERFELNPAVVQTRNVGNAGVAAPGASDQVNESVPAATLDTSCEGDLSSQTPGEADAATGSDAPEGKVAEAEGSAEGNAEDGNAESCAGGSCAQVPFPRTQNLPGVAPQEAQ